MIEKLKAKIRNIAARGIVQLLEGEAYQVTLLDGETVSQLEHLQEYGFASKKPASTKGNGICLFYGGNRGNGSLLVMEFPELKPSLEDGESAVFNSHGSIVKLIKNGIVQLNGSSHDGLVKINELTEKVNALISELQSHTHPNSIGNTLSPNQTFTLFNKADYENTKVVHDG